MARIVAVTACPTGIAHTLMAAEALKKTAALMGHEIRVETQGSEGVRNALGDREILAADVVIVAADAYVDRSRFGAKPLFETSTTNALNNGPSVVTAALAAPSPDKVDLIESVKKVKAARSAGQTGPYRHLMTGVSYMLPVVVAGGLILGAMMGFDVGGPVNKAAYTFSVGLLSSQVNAPMAAVMAAGMTPPLGVGLATLLFKNKFTHEEREAGDAALVLGAAFITEGAIPFAARDPLRVIPSLMLGSAVAGALSMVFGCQLLVPHGGIFAILIPGAVVNLPMYLVAIVVGALVTTAALFALKRPVLEKAR